MDLPEWLLIEVFTKLPAKFVFRSKLVCKHWLSLISDPSFVRTYISRASLLWPWVIVSFFECTDLCSLQCESETNIYSRALKRPSYLPLRYLYSRLPYTKDSYIYGISDGFVLYCKKIQSSKDGCFINNYICNPVTCQWMTLPPTTCLHRVEAWGFLTRVENGMLKSFRVVCVGQGQPLGTRTTMVFHVFSSEGGEWKDFSIESDLDIDVRYLKKRPPAVLHGSLHWVLKEKLILAYDPYQKPDELRMISLPRDRGQDGISALCGVCDGKLKYLETYSLDIRHPFTIFKVWVLDDYSSGDWSLQNNIKVSDICFDAFRCDQQRFFLVFAFDPNDSDVVYLGYANVIVSYNTRTKISQVNGHSLSNEELKQLINPTNQVVAWWTGLLYLIPPWPTSISLSSTEK